MSNWLIGVDTGGTFTDLVAFEAQSGEIRVAKVPSVPEDPSTAVSNAFAELFATGVAPADVRFLAHGTTVGTNALLEQKGVRAGLLITRGFRAVYEARSWSRPMGADLVDTFYQKPPLLAPQKWTCEITERVNYAGEVLTPLDEESVRSAARLLKSRGVDSIAVCYLFSFLNPAHEERTAAILAEEAPGIRVSLSSRVLPVIREYPRLSTTVVDAYVGPIIERYLLRLVERLQRIGVGTPQAYLMQSNGGLMRMTVGARYPNQTLLSGPAGGVVASIDLAARTGTSHIVTFDMGGTSTDICVIVDGRAEETSESRLGGQDVGTPALQIRTLGAGGGAIASIGRDGLLKVGPDSAGAVPGPACYGHGGGLATVTDANLLLGVFGTDSLLGARMTLDRGRAERAVLSLAERLNLDLTETAAGIVRIVNNNMAIALRLTLQEQGHDPRRFALVAFGGGGPIHAPQIARELRIPRVLVPVRPGLNSAMGMLQTQVRHRYLKSSIGVLSSFPVERMNRIFADLLEHAREDIRAEGFSENEAVITRQADIRYLHQGYQLTVDSPAREIAAGDREELKRAFDALHLRLYGQNAEGEEVEVVTFRLLVELAVPKLQVREIAAGNGDPGRARKGIRALYDHGSKRFGEAPVYQREKLRAGDRIAGPAIVEQYDATTVLAAGQRAHVDGFGNLVIDTGASQ